MHQNYYNHDESELRCRQHISNIAYRFNFKVIYEEDQVFKEENGTTTLIVDVGETPRNTLCWKAWRKLADEYGYSGIWKDRD